MTENLTEVQADLRNHFYDFKHIITIYKTVTEKNTNIEERLIHLKDKYNDLIKNNVNKVFLFCLNSLYFQYRILNFELENFNKISTLVQNRMYGDYYKFYNIILIQCKENNIPITKEDFLDLDFLDNTTNEDEIKKGNKTDLDVIPPPLADAVDDTNSSNEQTPEESADMPYNIEEQFPVYKDVDPFFRYKVEDIVKLHKRILLIINKLENIYVEKQLKIDECKMENNVGFSLNIFVDTLKYDNELLKGQIHLYMNYISFYHTSHRSYLFKLLKNNSEFLDDLDNNVLVNLANFEVKKSSSGPVSMGPVIEMEENLNETYVIEPPVLEETLVSPPEEESEPEVVTESDPESVIVEEESDPVADAIASEEVEPEVDGVSPSDEGETEIVPTATESEIDTVPPAESTESESAVEEIEPDNLEVNEGINNPCEDPCEGVVIENLSDNMIKAWQSE